MQAPLLLGGKRPGQALMATSDPGNISRGRLFYITDHSLGLRFLIDTGAEVSVVPPTSAERQTGQGDFLLRAANNTPIATYGTQPILSSEFIYEFTSVSHVS